MHGLLGHLSGQIPGLLNPAGPLGQGQHFAMAGAKLHPEVLFPVTIGDGGLGEPYIMSSFSHFHTAYPKVTNFLPILVWNGYSQEHHSMVSTKPNAEMIDHWRGNGFQEIILVNAKDYDDADQPGDFVDSTNFFLWTALEIHPSDLRRHPSSSDSGSERSAHRPDCQTAQGGRGSMPEGPSPTISMPTIPSTTKKLLRPLNSWRSLQKPGHWCEPTLNAPPGDLLPTRWLLRLNCPCRPWAMCP